MNPVRIGLVRRGRRRRGTEERSLGPGCGRGIRNGLDDKEVRIGGEEHRADASVCREKGPLAEGLAGGQIDERGEGVEGVADAQEEASVAEAPEILAMVVEPPRGTGDDVAARKLEEKGVDVAVPIVFGIVGHARKKAANGKGEEQVTVVDVVDGEQRTAGEKELRRERLEAQRLKGDAKRRFRPFGEERGDQ
jgi:hypothetical protein